MIENHEYEFRVAAVNAAGQGAWSSSSDAIVCRPPPCKFQYENKLKVISKYNRLKHAPSIDYAEINHLLPVIDHYSQQILIFMVLFLDAYESCIFFGHNLTCYLQITFESMKLTNIFLNLHIDIILEAESLQNFFWDINDQAFYNPLSSISSQLSLII